MRFFPALTFQIVFDQLLFGLILLSILGTDRVTAEEAERVKSPPATIQVAAGCPPLTDGLIPGCVREVKAKNFLITNKCSRKIRIAIDYLDTSAQWRLKAWYKIAPGVKTYLADEDPNLRLQSRNDIWYYYAETTGKGPQCTWSGGDEHSIPKYIDNQKYSLRRIAQSDVGVYSLDLTCASSCDASDDDDDDDDDDNNK